MITNSLLDSKEWRVLSQGKRYNGEVDSVTGLPDGMGILEIAADHYYVGELRQGKREGRGFMLRLEDRSRDERYWQRYSYEQVMQTAEFDSCGRVISTGSSGEWKTRHVEEFTFVKESDGQWVDDVLVSETDCSVLATQPWSGYTLMHSDLLLTSGDYPVDWGPWCSPLTEIESGGILKNNGYAHFVSPYDDEQLLVLNYYGDPPFIVPKGGMFYWDEDDAHNNHSQHFYALYPTGVENEFEIVDDVLVHCVVRQPYVEIPWGVSEIASESFVGANGKGQGALCGVKVPKTCRKIGSRAFAGCENLQHVLVLGPAEIGEKAFIDCVNLRHIELWRGVSSLGDYCLANCEKLPYIFIPITVSKVGKGICAQGSSETTLPTIYCQRMGPGKGWESLFSGMHKVVWGATPGARSLHYRPH